MENKKNKPALFMNREEKKQILIDGLLHAKENKDKIDSLTKLQNEMCVSFPAKVVAIAAIKDDDLSAYFAKAFADAYSANGFTSLIIDANLYNQKLKSIIGSDDGVEVKEEGREKQFLFVDKNTEAWCLDNEIYPSTVYKSGIIQNTINDNKDKYDHFILIVPSIKEHKEISLLKDVVDSIILVSQKNVTLKEHIYYAIQYLRENELPLAKTVVIK